MIMVNLLNWWYKYGWRDLLRHIGMKLANLVDFFSMGTLIKTLFAPFRQISAGVSSTAPIGTRLKMFVDRSVSRIVGAIVRSFILLAGVLCIGIIGILSFISIIIWPIIPTMPIIGIILTVIGVSF